MARLRKEKGGSSNPSSTSKAKTNPKKSIKGGDAILREQVLALGGTQDDLDLLKGVDDNTTGGSSAQDVCCISSLNVLT